MHPQTGLNSPKVPSFKSVHNLIKILYDYLSEEKPLGLDLIMDSLDLTCGTHFELGNFHLAADQLNHAFLKEEHLIAEFALFVDLRAWIVNDLSKRG